MAEFTLSIKAHQVNFVREKLKLSKIIVARDRNQRNDGSPVRVAALVLVRQRPATANGILFITIVDETGTANLVAFSKLFDKYRKEIVRARLLMVEGKLQLEGQVTHVIVKHC